MKYLTILLLLLSASAFAQQDYPRDLTLSWTNASQYVDGSVIEAGDLTGVRIECFRQNDTVPLFTGNFAPTGEGLAQSETFVGVIPNPGTYTCFGYSIVFDGTESDPSVPSSRKFIGKPKSIVFD